MSLMSIEVEPMNFISPPLLWKPGTKGFRNSSRRARKSVATSFTMGVDLSDECTRRANDKHDVVNVPIKKRRVRSLSPSSLPRTLSLVLGSNLTKTRFCRIKNACDRKKSSQKILKGKDTEFDCNDDFSGIELLADVACSCSIIDDVFIGKESSFFDETAQEGVDSLASAALVSEDKTGALSLKDGKSNVSQKSPFVDSTKTVEVKKSSESNRLHWDLNVAMDAWNQPFDMSCDNSQTSAMKNNFTVGNEKVQMLENCSIKEECKGTMVCDFSGAKSTGKIDDMKIHSDHSDCQAVSEKDMVTQPLDHVKKQSTEICFSDVQLKKILCAERAQPETGNDDSLSVSEFKGPTCKQAALLGVKVSSPGCAPNCEETSVSGISFVECQPAVALYAKGSANVSSSVKTVLADSPIHSSSVKLMQKSSIESVAAPRDACKIYSTGPPCCLNKVTSCDPPDDGYVSEIYQNYKIQSIGDANTMELHVGYDSQFEDGELRESDARYCWNEDEKGDVENVDYGSDSDEERPCGTDSGPEQNIEGGSTMGFVDAAREVENCGAIGASRDELESPKTKTSDMTIDIVAVRSRISNREFLNSGERSRFNNAANSYSRDGTRAEGLVRHSHGRSSGGHFLINPSSVYRNLEHYSRTCQRLKNIEGRGYISSPYHRDIAAKEFGGFDKHVRRQYVGSSSSKRFERNTRTKYSNQNDAYGTLPVRDVGPMSSSRLRGFAPSFDRGVCGRYYRLFPDDSAAYPNRMTYYMSGRDRSISPVGRARPYHGLQSRKSLSRSRSRSSTLCVSTRERIDISRVRSRSPDFKSDVRMDRMRKPFQKNFAVDHEVQFASPKSHFSLRHGYRSYNERHYPNNSFRRRRSPDGMPQ